jgi:hypothetical protein
MELNIRISLVLKGLLDLVNLIDVRKLDGWAGVLVPFPPGV